MRPGAVLGFSARGRFQQACALGGGRGDHGVQCWLWGKTGAGREVEAAWDSQGRGRKAPPSAQLPWSPEQMATLSPGVRAATFNTFKRLRSACRGSLADIQNRLKTRDGARRSGEL